MAPKYTILKVLIHNSSKIHNSKQGFTLIELIVGLLMMVIVSSLALNAFVEASISFNKDKKNIESNQNLSAVLEIIGNDIRQAGEGINDPKFPVIKIEPAATGDMPGSSKITIRRALTSPLTLCETIVGSAAPSTAGKLTVADAAKPDATCNVGTLVTTTVPASISRTSSVKEVRDYRCKLDDLNADYSLSSTTDFCQSPKASLDKENVLAAMSDGSGNIRTFRYTDDTEETANTKYTISFTGILSASLPNNGTYAAGTSPIYLIEERVYTLGTDNSVKLQIDGGTTATLIKGIAQFKVSARVYGNKETKESDTINAASPIVPPNMLPLSRRCDSTIPYYICQFNNTTTPDDWKTLQGVKVELAAKYDPTGRAATATTEDAEKLKAIAEYFPRNVLSK
ncbi:type II secretion system protein [Chamaesiphon sp. OTE_20_metabat_361]|uniref:PilW family protein n=1 Tax=Chamaesiphon sp. OTE_20_metabat_361 TaxID=2964689 RepID=UPI00286B318C|nr:type II secretion system protein [Chamaesiphon sp. OTE_20_metabat_361]